MTNSFTFPDASLAKYLLFATIALQVGCGVSEKQTTEPPQTTPKAPPTFFLDFTSMESDPFPVTWEDFKKSLPQIPDEQNAALVVLKAINHPSFNANEIKKTASSLYDFHPSNFPESDLTPADWSAIEALVNQTSSLINELKAITQMTAAKYPVEFLGNAVWFNMPLQEHVLKVKTLANLLSLHSVYHLKNGSEEDFFQILELLADLIQTLDNEWTTVDVLSKWAILSRMLDDIALSFSSFEPNTDNIDRILKILERFDVKKDTQRMLIGERIVLVEHLQKTALQVENAKPGEKSTDIASGKRAYLRNGSLTPLLYYIGLLSLPNLPPPASLGDIPAHNFSSCLTADLNAADQFFKLTLNNPQTGNYPEFWSSWIQINEWKNQILTQGHVEYEAARYSLDQLSEMLSETTASNMKLDSLQFQDIPVLSRNNLTILVNVFQKEAATLTKIRSLQAGIQILQYLNHQQLQSVPDNLQDFDSDFQNTWPDDPFTGNSIQYESLTNGFRVYSFGREHLKELTGSEEPKYDLSNPEIETIISFKTSTFKN